MTEFKPTELQKIILEILIEDPKKAWKQDDLVIEALKRERRIKGFSNLMKTCPNCGKPLEEHTHTQRTICHVELNK